MKPVTEYHTSAESFNASQARKKSLSLQIAQGRVIPGIPKKKPKKKTAKRAKTKKSKRAGGDFRFFVVSVLVALFYWFVIR